MGESVNMRPIPTRGHVGGGLYRMRALAPRGVRVALTLSAHQRYAAKSHKICTGCHRWALRPPPLFALCLVNQSASASIKNSLTDRERQRQRKIPTLCILIISTVRMDTQKEHSDAPYKQRTEKQCARFGALHVSETFRSGTT